MLIELTYQQNTESGLMAVAQYFMNQIHKSSKFLPMLTKHSVFSVNDSKLAFWMLALAKVVYRNTWLCIYESTPYTSIKNIITVICCNKLFY